ncbi:hypothetical protein NPIL_68781 [Nephila pilipes]|uniref:Uncharacterized protein n=1 Tax=Nephila pilipes TaxID=299642 RepID=A0A8X6QD43_NEPPI|nr:hypothetical protein NPIL_68781 [Nephila pilipes]
MVFCKLEREMMVYISHKDMVRCSRGQSDLTGGQGERKPASVTRSKMSTPNGIHSNQIDPKSCKAEVSSNGEHQLPPCRKKEPSSKRDNIE